LSFAWGLGIASNNIEKAYALMQGLRLAIEANIQSLIVVGDSKIVINKMVSKKTIVDNILASVLEREKKR
jgi:ribonuclease HI